MNENTTLTHCYNPKTMQTKKCCKNFLFFIFCNTDVVRKTSSGIFVITDHIRSRKISYST